MIDVSKHMRDILIIMSAGAQYRPEDEAIRLAAENLVALGQAGAVMEPGRGRYYVITDAGRAALAAPEPPACPNCDAERVMADGDGWRCPFCGWRSEPEPSAYEVGEILIDGDGVGCQYHETYPDGRILTVRPDGTAHTWPPEAIRRGHSAAPELPATLSALTATEPHCPKCGWHTLPDPVPGNRWCQACGWHGPISARADIEQHPTAQDAEIARLYEERDAARAQLAAPEYEPLDVPAVLAHWGGEGAYLVEMTVQQAIEGTHDADEVRDCLIVENVGRKAAEARAQEAERKLDALVVRYAALREAAEFVATFHYGIDHKRGTWAAGKDHMMALRAALDALGALEKSHE